MTEPESGSINWDLTPKYDYYPHGEAAVVQDQEAHVAQEKGRSWRTGFAR